VADAPGSDNDLRIHKFPVDIWGTHRKTIGIPVNERILTVLRSLTCSSCQMKRLKQIEKLVSHSERKLGGKSVSGVCPVLQHDSPIDLQLGSTDSAPSEAPATLTKMPSIGGSQLVNPLQSL
jgi:hypothetical protein